MPYDNILAECMRPFLLPRAGVSEKAMFGGIAFLVHGNMCCGIWPAGRSSTRHWKSAKNSKGEGRKDLLVIRLSVENGAKALEKPHVRVMDITGRPIKGWVFVEPMGCKKDSDLSAWVDKALEFASSLPSKKSLPACTVHSFTSAV